MMHDSSLEGQYACDQPQWLALVKTLTLQSPWEEIPSANPMCSHPTMNRMIDPSISYPHNPNHVQQTHANPCCPSNSQIRDLACQSTAKKILQAAHC
mmetsp:Transcript_143491/g.250468  ORF Transcript_143491/g.250468 Transcript_143491/m.250468 type:complete len:97 (+) Transcript_143491:233-523(+)